MAAVEPAQAPTTHDGCRVDVWLWRARFFRTRAAAGRFIGEGRLRLDRGREIFRLDKPSRTLRPGDALVFARDGRLFAVRVEAVGERRGPAPEARALYSLLDADHAPEVEREWDAA